MKLLSITLIATVMNITAGLISRADEPSLGFDAYGVSYLIEEKRVEELFYVTLEAFSYLNEIELKYKGRAERSILAISLEDIVEGGRFNFKKLSNVDERVASILDLFEAGTEKCLIRGYKTRELTADEASLESWKTVVVFNNNNDPIDEQLKCLYIGVLISFGVDKEKIEYYSKLESRELANMIINLEF